MDPRATGDDLTAKARIRNVALDLYARDGADRVSLRAIASEAGVTVGLVQHHFKTKDGLRAAVDDLVASYFAGAIARVPTNGTPAQIVSGRDEAVHRMLAANPPVVNYVRRAVLDPTDERLGLLRVIVDLTRDQVRSMRRDGIASTRRPESTQIVDVLVRQLGALLLQPLIDAVWVEVASGDTDGKPQLNVHVDH